MKEEAVEAVVEAAGGSVVGAAMVVVEAAGGSVVGSARGGCSRAAGDHRQWH